MENQLQKENESDSNVSALRIERNPSKGRSRLLFSFHIAGLTYYDGYKVINNFKIGTPLILRPDHFNPKDQNAIEISFEDFKLGFVPKDHNYLLYKMMLFGYEGAFECVVTQINFAEHPERQIRVGIFIKDIRPLQEI